MIRTFVLGIAVLAVLAGCRTIDQTSDNNTIVEPTPTTFNCKYDTATNSYGCYSSSVVFHNETVVDGLWSVYAQSNTNRTDNQVFYDRYLNGYDFYSDGSGGKQQQTDGYNVARDWGVNDSGSELTVSNDGTFTYSATFLSDTKCFEVTNNGDKLKLCHETYQNSGATASADAGYYYGTDVKFGNRTDYNYLVPGTWSLSGYGDNTASEALMTLDANGTIQGGGMWAVSGDGKLMDINGTRYLVYQYLEPTAAQCIAVFEMAYGTASSTKWTLCKE